MLKAHYHEPNRLQTEKIMNQTISSHSETSTKIKSWENPEFPSHEQRHFFDHFLTNPKDPNRILRKEAGLNRRPVRVKGVCPDSNQRVQQRQMAVRKILETISGMIQNRLKPKFTVKMIANEMPCLKAMYWHVETCIDWTSFNFRFKDFLSNLLLKIIICFITDQPSIARSRRSVLSFKFSFFTFLR